MWKTFPGTFQDFNFEIVKSQTMKSEMTILKHFVILSKSEQPDHDVDYLFGQGFGGVGRETLKLTSSIESLFTGEELPSYKIPLAGRFYGKASGKAAEERRRK